MSAKNKVSSKSNARNVKHHHIPEWQGPGIFHGVDPNYKFSVLIDDHDHICISISHEDACGEGGYKRSYQVDVREAIEAMEAFLTELKSWLHD